MADEQVVVQNNQLVLVAGYSSTGKSASLRNIRDQEKWMYLNSESGKRLPFKNKFETYNIVSPWDVPAGIDHATEHPDKYKGIIIDSMTFLMDMFETQFVINASNTMKAWGDYQQFFKDIMQRQVPKFGKPVIITAHVKDTLDEKAMEMKTMVPVKGALQNQGIEAYFSTIVAAKRIAVTELDKNQSDLLHIDEEEREIGFKHVFQTRLTKQTLGERLRSPMGMFNKNDVYMDNDCQLLLDHLHEYYK